MTNQPPIPQLFTTFPEGVRGVFANCCLTSPGLRIAGGSASPLAQAANPFGVRTNGAFPPATSSNTNMPALNGGNLAFDNGTVPPTTPSCRCYTFIQLADPVALTVSYLTIHGNDFPKNRWMNENTDINFGLGNGTILGFLYIKNESNAVFIPGTTNLDATGITATFGNAQGYVIA